MSAFGKTVGGKLRLKGVGNVTTSSRSKSKKRGMKRKPSEITGGEGSASAAAGAGDKRRRRDDERSDEGSVAERVEGTGTIRTSGTTVHGVGTRFTSDIKVGDAIEVAHPGSGDDEIRLVQMVLGDVSIGINEPFSSDLKDPVSFHCLRLPEEEESPEERERREKQEMIQEEKNFAGTYASEAGRVVTYRVKKPGAYGGYKIVQKRTDRPLTRTELLEQRAKEKSDRLCM